MTSTESVPTTVLSGPSPGKQALTGKQLSALLASSETRNTINTADLSLLYASVDSIASVGTLEFWKSKDLSGLFASSDMKMPPLTVSAPAPVAKPSFTSIDALHNFVPQIFASNDSLFTNIEPLPFKSLELQGLEVFTKQSEKPKSCKWLGLYEKGLRMPDAPDTVTEQKPLPVLKKPKKAKTQKRGEPKEKIYVEPRSIDIISGRGGRSNNHPGNKRYREVVDEMKPAYKEGQKFEKTIKSQEVVELLLAEGRRFLKLEGDRYFLMTKNQARRKAGQALREENTPESRKAKRDFYAKKNRS